MKKLILTMALFGLCTAQAQTIDTAKFKGFAVVRIATPFVVKWNDTTKARYLSVKSVADNFKDAATFTYILHSAAGIGLDAGIVECKKDDYNGWTGDNRFPFSFVATKLGITIH